MRTIVVEIKDGVPTVYSENPQDRVLVVDYDVTGAAMSVVNGDRCTVYEEPTRLLTWAFTTEVESQL